MSALALLLLTVVASAALAQDDIDFGDEEVDQQHADDVDEDADAEEDVADQRHPGSRHAQYRVDQQAAPPTDVQLGIIHVSFWFVLFAAF